MASTRWAITTVLLTFIVSAYGQMAKKAGFTLAEIKQLIDLQKNKESCLRGRDMAQEKRMEISQKMKALKKMDTVLVQFIEECEKNGPAGLNRPCHFTFDTKNV